MLNSFLPYLKCVFPLVAVALLVLGFVLSQKMIAATIITRPIPSGGFPSVEEEIRYVNEEPAELRRNKKYRSWIIFALLAFTCLPISYFVPAFILKMVLK
jgi:nitrate reductase NapE component